MRVTYDPTADAAYIYLTDDQLSPARQTVPVMMPGEMPGAIVALDFKDGKIVGLEVLDASSMLHAHLLASAEVLGGHRRIQ